MRASSSVVDAGGRVVSVAATGAVVAAGVELEVAFVGAGSLFSFLGRRR